MSEEACCANCRFSRPLEDAEDEFRLTCRRRAPRPNDESIRWWTLVMESDWCGEHEAIRSGFSVTARVTPEASVDALSWSVRTRTCFRRKGIETIADLLKCDAQDLIDIKGFGSGCLEETRSVLAAWGLKLKGDA